MEVGVNQSDNWRRKHWQALRTNYSKAPYWDSVCEFLQAFYARDWDMLAPLNQASIVWLRGVLGVDTELLLVSEMELSKEPTERLVDICKTVGADTYLAGADGRKYMNLESFSQAGIDLVFQDYHHPVYPQLFADFESHLSALDLVLNCGPESLEFLRAGRQ